MSCLNDVYEAFETVASIQKEEYIFIDPILLDPAILRCSLDSRSQLSKVVVLDCMFTDISIGGPGSDVHLSNSSKDFAYVHKNRSVQNLVKWNVLS